MKNTSAKKSLTIEYARDFTHQIVAGSFEKQGFIPPTLVCFAPQHPIVWVTPQLADDKDRDQFASDFRTFCISEAAMGAVWIAEVWLGSITAAANGIRPSQDPDRREHVIAGIELPGTQVEVHLWPIIRDGDAKPKLGKGEILPCNQHQVPFSQLLPTKPPTEAERIVAATFMQRRFNLVRVNPFQNN